MTHMRTLPFHTSTVFIIRPFFPISLQFVTFLNQAKLLLSKIGFQGFLPFPRISKQKMYQLFFRPATDTSILFSLMAYGKPHMHIITANDMPQSPYSLSFYSPVIMIHFSTGFPYILTRAASLLSPCQESLRLLGRAEHWREGGN